MSDINMTPLIDVMLVLVVIFIITAPLLASTIALDLPKADSAPATHAPPVVSVAIDAAGNTYLNNQPIGLDALPEQLARAHHLHPDAELQLRADQSVAYGRVVSVMAAAQRAGLNRIGFVTDPPSGRASQP
jgi:biopolymer transport protein TolR